MDNKERVLVYGALLHDIGKAIQRANGMKYSHPVEGRFFIRDQADVLGLTAIKEQVMDIVKNHHDNAGYNSLLGIVKNADWLSAKYDREKYKGEDFQEISTTPLQCIFSEIELENKRPTQKLYNPVVPLSKNIENHIPSIDGKAYIDYARINRELINDISTLKEVYDRGKIDTLNYILMKNLKFVPSAIYETIPDIPLYDHLKTTAAIALSLYRGEKDKPFLLIGGEISGIQRFIFYNISAQEADSHAAKRFRGRSFFINLFTDSVVRYIMEKLDLYEFSVLVNTAGHFMILAPNNEKNRELLKEIRYNVNKYLLEKEIPELYMTMAWKECTTKSMENFKELLADFYTEKLATEKMRKFHDLLSGEEREMLFNEETHINVCPSCGRKCEYCNPEKRCELCTAMEEIGKELVNARYMARGIGKDSGIWIFKYGEFKLAYDLLDSDTHYNFEEWEVFDIREVKIPDFGATRGFRIFGSYAPKKDMAIMSFEEIIGREHKGKENLPKLAIFKADVDNLGLIFKEGIGDMSISRYSHLSFMLDFFFAVKSTELAEKHNVYLLFAGGDDLSAIGRYDDILAFGKEIQKEFRKWCAENPAISISGGMAMVGVKFPVRRLVEYGEKELEIAKHADADKNKISIFNTPLSWEEFAIQMELADKLEKYRKEGKIGGGFSHYLINIHKKRPCAAGIKDREIIVPRPYIVYYLQRNFRIHNEDDKKKRDELVEEIENNFNHINVGASIWALNRRYFGEKGGIKNE